MVLDLEPRLQEFELPPPLTKTDIDFAHGLHLALAFHEAPTIDRDEL